MARYVDVELRVTENPDTGERFIWLTDFELREKDAEIKENAELARTMLQSDDAEEKARGAALKQYSDAMRRAHERYKKIRAEKWEGADVVRYRLRIPSWREYRDAKTMATIINDESGETRIDWDKLKSELLPKCVEGLTAEEIDEIEAPAFEKLWQRLAIVLEPAPGRIPFVL